MRFSVGLPGVTRYPPILQEWEPSMGPGDFQTFSRTADELGFDSITIPEHIVMPDEMAGLMGAFWTHAFTAMAFVAGATSRITVDSSVIVVPYHQPVVFAKAVSTLDLLSGGRVRLSIGIGHAEKEFDAVGTPFHERGKVADEYLAAMVELWTADKPEFHGRYVDFEGVAFEPKPVQTPHPPIWVGGNSKAAMRRAARHDGWYPWLITVDQLPQCLDYIRSQPDFEARARPFDVAMPVSLLQVDEEHRPVEAGGSGRPDTPSGKQAIVDAVGRLREAGATWTSVPTPPSRSLVEHLEQLQWVAEEIIPQFR